MIIEFEPVLKWDCVRSAVSIADQSGDLGHNEKMVQLQFVSCFVGCAAEWAKGLPDLVMLQASGSFVDLSTEEICGRLINEIPGEFEPDENPEADLYSSVFGITIPLLLELLER